MIEVYLAGISTQYEGEDTEVRYAIFEDQELLCKESVLLEYKKPALVGQFALITLLKKLEKYQDKELLIIVNDGALYEIIRGTSKTKNKDVLKMAGQTKKELSKFNDCVIKNVSGNYAELVKWNEILHP